jgi:hypothetical protein
MRFLRLPIAVISITPAVARAQPPQEPPPEPPPYGAEPAEVSETEDFVEQGTLEVGGAIGAIITEDTSTFTASPIVGYFVADRIQVAGIFQIAYTRIEDELGEDDSNTVGSLIVEPSYHYPVGDEVAVAGGIGLGGGYDGEDINFQVIPSVGLDIMTSRETVVTPTLRIPIVIGDDQDPNGGVETNLGLALDVGISALW